MNTPDKIYVFQHGINAFDPLWHFTESKEKYTESHEYIRKDALTEYISERKKYYRGLIPAEGAIAFIRAFDEMMKHIESL